MKGLSDATSLTVSILNRLLCWPMMQMREMPIKILTTAMIPIPTRTFMGRSGRRRLEIHHTGKT
eukprot:1034998-Ditylum_brightwellii.AAC.1